MRVAGVMVMVERAWLLVLVLAVAAVWAPGVQARDENQVYSPCNDTKVQKNDGFTFGLAFASNESFYFNGSQLSPCDSRLALSGGKFAVFRPKVDEISLLTINYTDLTPQDGYGSVVAFSGVQYAARSVVRFVANGSYIITSLTLVLEFDKGRLVDYLWKDDKCSACQTNTSFVCINGKDCAIPTGQCTGRGGNVDCSVSLQVTFSGVDKRDAVLNSWYQVKNLRQYSLYSLYDNLKNTLTDQFNPWG